MISSKWIYNFYHFITVLCCASLYVSSICGVYDDYYDVIGDYTGVNVENDDGSITFKYTQNANSDITLELYNNAGTDEVKKLFSVMKQLFEV